MTLTRRSSRTPLRLAALVGVAALTFALGACGSDSDTGAEGGGGGGGDLPPGDVVITADNVAWDKDALEAPADADYVIVVDNKDEGVQHNLSIEDTDFTTELESGPVAQVLQINLSAGEYDYICDLHPNMSGTLTVE